MVQSKSWRRLGGWGAMLAGGVAATIASAAAVAQNQPAPANERTVHLVRQDLSDCRNSTVPDTDGPNVAGTVSVIRGSDGNTTVKVALTATPKTTYHFFLKCQQQLGDIVTGNDGAGQGTFSFPTKSGMPGNEVGDVYAFDSYPEGAPPGNKFQSVQVNFK